MSPALWPSARQYVDAIGIPGCRGPTDLREASLREGLFGLPSSASGQHAIVFPLDTADGPEAVKCFTSPPADALRQRYLLLGTYLRPLTGAPLVRAEWCDRGVQVDGQWWPAVRMPWLPGDTLDVAVEQRLEEPERLVALADTMRRAIQRLRACRLAHGDLQHGNALVPDDDVVHLVDYDVVWFPGGETLVPDEVGHRNYQHPERIRTGAWGPAVDAFSALVIHTSLHALANDPSLWQRHNRGENLVFAEEDLRSPASSAVFAELAGCGDEWVRTLASATATCATAPLRTVPDLEELLRSLREDGSVPLRDDVDAPGKHPDWLRPPELVAQDVGRYADVGDDWAAAEMPPEAEFVSGGGAGRRWFRRRR
ncbi:MAG: hypothetical protein JJU45_09565 [Acidimicrobiia bacterium]|nr:hypothetical protein [Acidimicrobiia bacterium]